MLDCHPWTCLVSGPPVVGTFGQRFSTEQAPSGICAAQPSTTPERAIVEVPGTLHQRGTVQNEHLQATARVWSPHGYWGSALLWGAFRMQSGMMPGPSIAPHISHCESESLCICSTHGIPQDPAQGPHWRRLVLFGAGRLLPQRVSLYATPGARCRALPSHSAFTFRLYPAPYPSPVSFFPWPVMASLMSLGH